MDPIVEATRRAPANAPDRVALYLSWGAGSAGVQAIISGLTFFALFYFVSIIGLSPAVAGTVLLIGKLVDAVSYPLMGLASDRLDTRWGRRRPWMLAGTVLGTISFVMLFNVPATLEGIWLPAWITVVVALLAMSLAVYYVPYFALAADIARNEHERTRLMAYRSAWFMFGTFAGSAAAGMLVARLGGGRTAYAAMGWAVGAFVALSLWAGFAGTRRVPIERTSATRLPGLSWTELRSMFANRAYVVIVGVKALQFFGLAGQGAALLFFITYVMRRDANLLAVYGAVIIATALVAMKLWIWMPRRIGKANAFRVSTVGWALATVSWLVAGPNETMAVFVLRSMGVGVFSTGFLVCGQSMLLDAIDHDRQRSGLAREGMLSAMYAFVEKIAGALGPFVVGLVLAGYGFQAGGKPPADPADTLAALRIGVVAVPVLACIAMAVLLRYYRLEPTGNRTSAVPESAVAVRRAAP